jgi:hypothetical protein
VPLPSDTELADRLTETAWARARREFKPVFLGELWAWFLTVVVAIAASGAGSYFAWGQTQNLTVAIGVGFLVLGAGTGAGLVVAGMKISANEALVSGLILAAREFPPEALKPWIEEFWKREAAEASSPDSEPS